MTDMKRALELLEAGDWEAAHRIVQEDESTVAAWAHGIVHLMEGDVANAGYWYRRADRSLPHRDGLAGEIEALKRALAEPSA